jgi:hypothetical protein
LTSGRYTSTRGGGDVAVTVAVGVGALVAVLVAVATEVAVMVGVAVTVWVGVEVEVGVGVAVEVGVGVGVAVAVCVGVEVGVAVGREYSILRMGRSSDWPLSELRNMYSIGCPSLMPFTSRPWFTVGSFTHCCTMPVTSKLYHCSTADT